MHCASIRGIVYLNLKYIKHMKQKNSFLNENDLHGYVQLKSLDTVFENYKYYPKSKNAI